jgi:hypothetical protein
MPLMTTSGPVGVTMSGTPSSGTCAGSSPDSSNGMDSQTEVQCFDWLAFDRMLSTIVKTINKIDNELRAGGVDWQFEEIDLSTVTLPSTMSHKCSECALTYATEIEVTRHIARFHTRAKPFKCAVTNCDSDFYVRANFDTHMATHSSGDASRLRSTTPATQRDSMTASVSAPAKGDDGGAFPQFLGAPSYMPSRVPASYPTGPHSRALKTEL